MSKCPKCGCRESYVMVKGAVSGTVYQCKNCFSYHQNGRTR